MKTREHHWARRDMDLLAMVQLTGVQWNTSARAQLLRRQSARNETERESESSFTSRGRGATRGGNNNNENKSNDKTRASELSSKCTLTLLNMLRERKKDTN